MTTGAAAQPTRRRVRKRIWIPSALLGVLLLSLGWLWWRGTSAETVERNPASAADGAVTQLLSQGDRIGSPAPPVGQSSFAREARRYGSWLGRAAQAGHRDPNPANDRAVPTHAPATP